MSFEDFEALRKGGSRTEKIVEFRGSCLSNKQNRVEVVAVSECGINFTDPAIYRFSPIQFWTAMCALRMAREWMGGSVMGCVYEFTLFILRPQHNIRVRVRQPQANRHGRRTIAAGH